MHYLLDSHIIYWTLVEPSNLLDEIKAIIENKDNGIYISQVSLMEFTIKMNIGKLSYVNGILDLLKDISSLDFKLLLLANKDLEEYSKLTLYHRDPFDRFLIAQAKSNNMTIITSDRAFKEYDVSLVFNELR